MHCRSAGESHDCSKSKSFDSNLHSHLISDAALHSNTVFNDNHSVKCVTFYFISANTLFTETRPLTAPPLFTSRDVGFKFQPVHT